MTLGAPVSASIDGQASFTDGSSFEEQILRTVPLPSLDLTLTAVQLFGEDADGIVHDVSFVYIAGDGLTTGTYDVNSLLSPCTDAVADCSPGLLFTGSLFTAQYARQTPDSLFTYGLDVGSVTVDEVSEEAVRGTFDLSATVEVAVARTDLRAYIDSLRDAPSRLEPSYFPTPPPSDSRVLREPLTVTGTFTATPGEVTEWADRFGWMMGGASLEPGRP
jgi:predicted amino acid-binding ACT domain protein